MSGATVMKNTTNPTAIISWCNGNLAVWLVFLHILY